MSYRYDDDYDAPRAPRRTSTAKPRAQASGDKKSAPRAKRAPANTKSAQRPRARDDYDYQPLPRKQSPQRASGARPAPARRPSSRRRRRRTNPMLSLLYWVLAVALAFGVSYFIREYGFEIVRVSGDGMYSTLEDGDLALVTKFDYKEGAPARGDVVAVELGGQKGVILRRIVGLPGESIEVKGGDTLINGSKLLEQYIGLRNYESFEGKTMPPGKYYLLGDNRSEQNDSRDPAIALIDVQDIVGKVRWVIWPLNHMGSL